MQITGPLLNWGPRSYEVQKNATNSLVSEKNKAFNSI